MTITTAESKSS